MAIFAVFFTILVISAQYYFREKNVLFEFVHTRVKCVIACQMFMVTVYGSKTVAVESVVGLDDNELDC